MEGFTDRLCVRRVGGLALAFAAAFLAAEIASASPASADAATAAARDARNRGRGETMARGDATRPALLLAHLSEQTLPAEEMRTTVASPAASPVAAPPAAGGAAAGDQPPAPSGSALPGAPAAEAPSASSPRLPSDSEAAVRSEPPITNDAAGGTASPAAASSPGELPPMGEGASAMLMVSDSPLVGLIGNATSPARSVSLRLADRAREDILNGQTSEAIQALTRALSVDSSDPYVYFYLGRAYLKKNDDHQALTFFQRAEIGLAADPIWLGETLGFEGACYERLGKTPDAIAAYRRAIDSSPNNLMARTGYARLVSAAEPPPLNGPPNEQAPGTAPGSALQPPPNAPAPEPPPSPPTGY